MKILGVVLLVGGLLMGVFAMTMDVAVSVPAKNYGYGISTPEMQVANVDRMEQRRNFTILSAALIVGGVLLIGFASVATKTNSDQQNRAMTPDQPSEEVAEKEPAAFSGGVAICPECRSMYPDTQKACRCGHVFSG